jgi:uncharacterized protein YjiS (DUF1127 family)
MGFLPNILPAHPEAPEVKRRRPRKYPGRIGHLIRKLKQARQRRRDQSVLRKLSENTSKDIAVSRAGLRTAHLDRPTPMRQPV